MAKAKPTAAPPADIEVLPALPEQQFAATDGKTILGFIAGLVPFFSGASELETKAKDTLARSKALTLPAPGDVEADAALQVFIKTASADKKVIEKYWEITSLINGFHKKLVAARNRPTDWLDEAAKKAQQLHNTYVEDANRRAREQTERDRVAAETRARQDREAEVARMEADAVAREAASPVTSEREEQFVALVASNGAAHATAAAKTVGYKDWQAMAVRLMATPKIQHAIAAKLAAAEIRKQAEAVKEKPLEVEVEVTKAAVQKTGSDRTTWGAEAFDPAALLTAALDPLTRTKLGIPADVLMINPVKLNEYGKALHEAIDKWPGCRHTKKTTTV